MSALAALRKGLTAGGGSDDKKAHAVPSRLEQNFCNMVDKIVTKQRLGYCKSQVRNQETMEARDALRKASLPRLNLLDETQFKEMLLALESSPNYRNDEEVDRIVECLKIMRSLDQFALPDGILRELAQTMIYDTYRMRDRIIMEGEEMKGMFKLCLAGIMQTDIDEFKNAVYLETGEYFCEEHLRPHIRNNPEPLVMMCAKHTSHIVTIEAEHYERYLQPCFQREHEAKLAILQEHSSYRSFSEQKLNALTAVSQICTFHAGEPIVESGRTKLTRYNDHHNGIFHMLMGQAAAFKQVEPVKEEKKKDMFMERLREEAEKKTKEDAVGLAKIRRESTMTMGSEGGDDKNDKHRKALERRALLEQRQTNKTKAKSTRRQSIEMRTSEIMAPPPPPPPQAEAMSVNKMGGPGQLYENMLMPLDDMQYGADFKLAQISLSGGELTKLLGDPPQMDGLRTLRSISDAIVMCSNPNDYAADSKDSSAPLPQVYIKGPTADVNQTLDYIRTLGLRIKNQQEVNPYAPAELMMPVPPEHAKNVEGLMAEVAQETHTEIQAIGAAHVQIHSHIESNPMTAIKIIGREGDCKKALQRIQSQLEKKMWMVESRTLRPGQSFGEMSYVEGVHPMMSNKKKRADGIDTSVWKNTTIVCLTHVECLVITVNDFGDAMTPQTHTDVMDTVENLPGDEAIRKTLMQYKQWDKYKTQLVAEIKSYNTDANNFGLPAHMPKIKDETKGDIYLHMYVERDGPDKKPPVKPHKVHLPRVMQPARIGADHFSRK